MRGIAIFLQQPAMRLALLSTLFATTPLAVAADPALAAEKPALKIGDPAPRLHTGRWIQGAPVRQLEKGKVYLIEFWATWCAPCKEQIPHLERIHRTFASKGLVVIGQDVMEQDERQVRSFVAGLGKKLTYRVALDLSAPDEGPGRMETSWMRAAGEGGIPVGFLVDRKGAVAWIGHPANLTDALIEQVLAGRHDLAALAAQRAVSRAEVLAARADLQSAIEAMARSREHLARGEAALALASEQTAIKHLLAFRELQKKKKGTCKRPAKAPPASLAQALEKLAAAEQQLASQIQGRAPLEEDRRAWQRLMLLLGQLHAESARDEKLRPSQRQKLGRLRQRSEAAGRKLAEADPVGASSSAALQRTAEETHQLAVELRANDNQSLAQQLDRLQRDLTQAAATLGRKPGQNKGDGPGSVSRANDQRAEAARIARSAGGDLGAILGNPRDDLNEVRQLLGRARVAPELGRLALAIPSAKSSDEDRNNAGQLAAMAVRLGEAVQALGRGESERLAKALEALPKSGKAGANRHEDLARAGTLMADSEHEAIRLAGGQLLGQAQKARVDARRWPGEAELASARALLLQALRALRASELKNAREAPLPAEYESISEAYLRALSDDLDDT
jgi:thiol-disulfide isomerase/thioredoxin